MRRRLQIARALLAEPRILILDEPTTGLDPQARQLIWERIRELAGAGTTIVLTTHYMEEAARLCDRLLVMDQGRILEQGSPAELVRRHIGREVLELQDLAPQEADRLADLADPPGERIGAHLVFRTDRGAELLESIRSRGLLPERYLLRPATLEDVFLRLTGRDLRE